MPSPTEFDKLSFRKTVTQIGRSYRKQATELVSICRTFDEAQEQTPDSDARLRAALGLVDDALKAAVDAGKKTSIEADAKFSEAIKSLKEYVEDYYHNKPPDVEARMERAKANDKSSSAVLNRLKETFTPMKTVPTKNVEFRLQKSLPDASPTTVIQELCERSDQNELLWNFCHFADGKGRLALKKNPHFYTHLPTSPEGYGVEYSSKSILENFFQHETISVLEDGPGRVYLEITKRRAFGGVWLVNNVIIFKDVQGKLEGEGLVGGAFQNTHDLSCFEESPQSSTSRPSIQDWKEPIHTMLHSQGVDLMVHITANQPGNGSPGTSSPARPRPRSMRHRTPHPIRGTYSKSPNLKQQTSPPQTTSTNVLPSSSALSQPQAAITAVPSSSLASPPQIGSRTSPPRPACTPAPPSSDSLPPPRTSPVSPRQPVSTAAPPSSVPSQPRTSSAPSTRPATTAALPSSTTSTIPHPPSPQPPPTSASWVTGIAKSAEPIACPPPDVSLNQGPHRGALQGAVPDTSTGHEGNDGRTPIQARGNSPQVEHARTPAPVRASPPPQVQAQVIDSQPKTQPVPKKKSWFQKHVWDYNNK